MNAQRTRSPIEPTFAEKGLVWFLRVVAIYCLFLGLSYWIRLVGIHAGNLWRFDLMPDSWKAAATSLAVLFPVAATGLWLLAPWGPVIWFLAVAVEGSIYTVFAGTFGHRPMVAITHALMIALYIGLRLTIVVQKHQTERLAKVSEH